MSANLTQLSDVVHASDSVLGNDPLFLAHAQEFLSWEGPGHGATMFDTAPKLWSEVDEANDAFPGSRCVDHLNTVPKPLSELADVEFLSGVEIWGDLVSIPPDVYTHPRGSDEYGMEVQSSSLFEPGTSVMEDLTSFNGDYDFLRLDHSDLLFSFPTPLTACTQTTDTLYGVPVDNALPAPAPSAFGFELSSTLDTWPSHMPILGFGASREDGLVDIDWRSPRNEEKARGVQVGHQQIRMITAATSIPALPRPNGSHTHPYQATNNRSGTRKRSSAKDEEHRTGLIMCPYGHPDNPNLTCGVGTTDSRDAARHCLCHVAQELSGKFLKTPLLDRGAQYFKVSCDSCGQGFSGTRPFESLSLHRKARQKKELANGIPTQRHHAGSIVPQSRLRPEKSADDGHMWIPMFRDSDGGVRKPKAVDAKVIMVKKGRSKYAVVLQIETVHEWYEAGDFKIKPTCLATEEDQKLVLAH